MSRPLKLFNLDLHISVIEDIRSITQRIFGPAIEITNWSISGHNWVFQKPTAQVDIINAATWKNINLALIQEFQTRQDSELSQQDGFIVTHTPVFALLFAKQKKPILIVNSCRYDQPFCWNQNSVMKLYLNTELRRMVQCNQLVIVSNNAADYKYLLESTGIQSMILPSLCEQTNAPQNPQRPQWLLYGKTAAFPPHPLLAPKPSAGYRWTDLAEYQGIIHAPYEMSTMSIFEQYWTGIPLFFPTKRFQKECIQNGSMEFISIYSKWNTPLQEAEVDKWLTYADFQLLPQIHYYDSVEDLLTQITNFTDPHKAERLQWIADNKKEILQIWQNLFVQHFKVSVGSPVPFPQIKKA